MKIIKDSNRESQFELLRIISMLMIVSLHIIVRGISLWVENNDSLVLNKVFPMSEKLFLENLCTICIYGVNIFVLISGYFSIKNCFKKFIELYLIIILYNVINLVVIFLLRKHLYMYNIMAAFLPISYPHSWFIQNYFYLVLIAPILNVFTNNSSRRQLEIMILIFTFFMCYLGFIRHINPFYNGYNVFNFILLYFIGRYINIYKVRIKTNIAILGFLVCVLILSLSNFLSIYYFFTDESLACDIMWYDNPILIFGSVFFFLVFVNVKFYNKYVNWIASSILSVYLLQEGAGLIYEQNEYSYINYLFNHENVIIFLFLMIIYILVLFVAAIVIDKIIKFCIHSVLIPLSKHSLKI